MRRQCRQIGLGTVASTACHSDRPTGAEEPAVVVRNGIVQPLISVTSNPIGAEYSSAMGDHLYSTYIVASRSRTLYIGVTGDLRRRVFQHKWREYDGFRAKYNCDRLVWFEHFQEVGLAIARETQLKKWSRAKKIALIERMNPSWAVLGRDWFEYEPADCKKATGRSLF